LIEIAEARAISKRAQRVEHAFIFGELGDGQLAVERL
jgi:hypothetical protein